MKTFLTPDKTWKSFGITSKQDFIEKFITAGKFHKNVPTDIQKDYEIVERLQFYSYYKFELLDEAFAKATRIFEASIDLRIKSLGLEKKDRPFEPLHAKLTKLEKHTIPDIFEGWKSVKELRNVFAHHKAGRSLADQIFHAFKDMVNLINTVFLDIDELLSKEKLFQDLKAEAAFFEEGLFIMKWGEQLSVISACIPHAIMLTNETKQSFWRIELVYPKEVINDLNDFGSPIFFTLQDVEIAENALKGTVVDTNDTIEIFPTDIPECVKRKEMYDKAVLIAPQELKRGYDDLVKRLFEFSAAKFFYGAW